VNRFKALAAVAALAATLGIAAGCVSSDPDAADTPTDAPTAENTGVQTDADGNTIETQPSDGPPADGGGDGGGGDGAAVEAGLVVFQASCTSCHLGDGADGGGIGPQLAGQGLDPAGVRAQIVNGGGGMPAGLASGTDLDDVVTYVESLQ